AQAMVVAYLPSDNEFVRNLGPAIPFVLLFAALIARRELRLPERIRTHSEPEPPSPRTTWAIAAIAVLIAIPASGIDWMTPARLLTGSKGLVFAAITISLVLLTGLSGQVSLMQMSFAGLGAVVLAKLPDGVPFVISLGISAVVVGLFGGLVALPALRLRGLYLALLTLALAIMMDNLVFGNRFVLGGGTTLAVERPSLFGINFESERAMFVVLVVVAGVFANVFLAVRRSSFGRKLAAMRDAPNACQTLGMNLTLMKLKVFGLSALMAGVAGAFLGGLQSRIGQLDFLWFRSLSVLLVATVFGITSVSGAFMGALFFVVLPDLISAVTSGDSDATASLALQPLIIGLLAIVTARRPEGLAGQLRDRVRGLIRSLPSAVWSPAPERRTAQTDTEAVPEVSLAR
ncbi:MAG: branched-chain amino acid ABC transporter permease, partial [Actinomycetota bacterium]